MNCEAERCRREDCLADSIFVESGEVTDEFTEPADDCEDDREVSRARSLSESCKDVEADIIVMKVYYNENEKKTRMKYKCVSCADK